MRDRLELDNEIKYKNLLNKDMLIPVVFFYVLHWNSFKFEIFLFFVHALHCSVKYDKIKPNNCEHGICDVFSNW